MSHLHKGLAFLVVLSVCSFTLASCTPETRYKVLSFFFDGVQKPGEEPGAKELEQPPAKKPVEQKETVVQATPAKQEAPVELPRPPIEALKGWEQVLRALPKDFAGGPTGSRRSRRG